MKQPEISVVVPVYNTSKYLKQCMLSILNQTFKDVEIICIDDGSTDDSLEILKQLARQDTRICIIHRDRASGGAAVPRNIGLEKAKGRYIIFLDSDDYFDCRMFEKMHRCAEEKNADLVMCDNYRVSSTDNSVKDCEGELHHKYIKQRGTFSYRDIPDTIFQISNAPVWDKLILRDVLVRHQLKFQENVPVLDDIYFVNLLLILSGRIYILDEKLVYYREYRGGGQTDSIEKHKESVFLAFDKLNNYLIENNLYAPVKKSLQNWTLDTLAWWYYSVKDDKTAEELFFLYKNSYFLKLGLMDMDDSEIYHHKDFYNLILYEEYRPSVSVILNSVLLKGGGVVLYGGGTLGKNIYEYIRNTQLDVLKLWCDLAAEKIGNPLIQKPENIKNYKYDAVLIAIGRADIVSDVKEYLKGLGVDENKIYTL